MLILLLLQVKAKPEFHRYLIGRNGANIRKIRDKTGARIIFPNESDDVKDVITIIGKKVCFFCSLNSFLYNAVFLWFQYRMNLVVYFMYVQQ